MKLQEDISFQLMKEKRDRQADQETKRHRQTKRQRSQILDMSLLGVNLLDSFMLLPGPLDWHCLVDCQVCHPSQLEATLFYG